MVEKLKLVENRFAELSELIIQPDIISDQKRLEVDTYSRFKIIDPLLFYQTVETKLVQDKD